MWMADGMTSQPYSTSSIMTGWSAVEVASGLLVTDGDLIVHGGQQRAGAAREVAYSQLPDGVGVGPVNAVNPFGRLRTELGDGQSSQQRRR